MAQASQLDPARLAFDRTTVSVKRGPGINTKKTVVERWNGRRWTLLSINGGKPTEKQKTDLQQAASSAPVPSYHNIARMLTAAGDVTANADGTRTLKIPVMPAGTVRTDTGDISKHLTGEMTIAEQGGKPYVQRLKVTARETFKLNMLIKVIAFEQISHYKLDTSGTPRLASQTADSSGSMFGFGGGEKSEVTYNYR